MPENEERKMLKQILPEDNPALQIIYLDEIAGRLAELNENMVETTPEGVVEPIEPVEVEDEVRRVKAPFKPWFCVSVTNDGPDDVYALVNSSDSFQWHRVAVDETYKVDMERPLIGDVLLKCENGDEASVRVVGSR